MGFRSHPARHLGYLQAACSHPPVWLSLRLQHPLYGGAFDAPIMLLKLDAPTLQAVNPHLSPSPSKSKLSL
ncbi:hypothetical protein I315_02476 [Cryptococcus gattii Ru294]|nr:hypothetical protein I315_02476 [Cryptococcus gattii Ru294]